MMNGISGVSLTSSATNSTAGIVADWGAQLIPPMWFGLLIGVSFVATPVKFKAASLTLPVALDVGRETFHLLNRLEWIVGILLLAALWASGAAAWKIGVGVVLCTFVALQTFWLLPVLDDRVALIIQGTMPPKTYHHLLYGVVEMGKAILLITLTVRALTLLRQGTPVS